MSTGSGEGRPGSGAGSRELASADTELPADSPASARSESPAAVERGADEDERGPRPGRMRAIGPGDELGRYVVGEELGAGGMATVFRARDRELRRDVAIKVLFPHLARKQEVTRRFQREARAAAGLAHANILRVYDVGGAAGDLPPFIVMELVRGATLRELAEGSSLPAELVACVGALVCEALAVAHAAGIVHRDVKPGNVMFADDGRLLLADFGVARLDDDDSLVTRTGALLGTPSFMAPEQALGQTDARSDLYAVGATLYQLATGSMPYTGPTAKIITEASRGSATPAVRRRPAIGSELSRLIARLMDPDPAKRPASAAEAARELATLAAAGGIDDPAAELRALAADREGHVAARLPGLVTRLVERAEAARTRRGGLPLAIALCDRALAMAPEDPRVHALEAALSRSGRWRMSAPVVFLALACGVPLAAFAAIAIRSALRDEGRPGPGPSVGLGAVDAGLEVDAAPAAGIGLDLDAAGAPAPDPADAATAMVSVTLDAGRPRGDGGRPPAPIDAARAALAIDAAAAALAPAIDAAAVLAPPIDAAAAPVPAIDAGPALLAVTFTFDTWCNLTVDGVAQGRVSNKTLIVRLPAGPHRAACSQGPGLGSWSGAFEVVAGAANRVSGELLPRVDVVVEVGEAVRIDGFTVPRGSSLTVKAGPHRVEVVTGGTAAPPVRVDVPGVPRCTLRDRPRLGCYP